MYKSAGFTLLELLVVIAIIGLLSAVVFGSLSESKDKAKEVVTIKEVRKLNEAIFMYELHTSTKFECPIGQVCTDNLIVNPGINGWAGPYIKDSEIHPWGGQIIITKAYNLQGGLGARQTLIFLTDDRSLVDLDNSAKIPTNSMLNIDRALDDGNLGTGLIIRFPYGSRGMENQLLIQPEI